MKMLPLLAFLIFASVCEGGNHFVSDGNSLADGIRLYRRFGITGKLTTEQNAIFTYTVGYLDGFRGSSLVWSKLEPASPFKLPKGGISTDQLISVVEKYLADHPGELHEPAAPLVAKALMDAFPNPAFKMPEDN